MKSEAALIRERSRLLHLVTEHAMRVCEDELLVVAVRRSAPGSEAAFTALGKLLTQHPTTLHAGSPLHCFVTGSGLDEAWRERVVLNQQGLWATLEFYTALYPDDEVELDPLDNYIRLRQLSLGEISE